MTGKRKLTIPLTGAGVQRTPDRRPSEITHEKRVCRYLSLRTTGRGTTSTMEGGGKIEFKEYEVAANGITLHVTEIGHGPVVLFCHGFPDTSYTWRQQMKAVASAGFRAIAPDMRGYGRSSSPPDSTCIRRCRRRVPGVRRYLVIFYNAIARRPSSDV
jgi:hypothetical protein